MATSLPEGAVDRNRSTPVPVNWTKNINTWIRRGGTGPREMTGFEAGLAVRRVLLPSVEKLQRAASRNGSDHGKLRCRSRVPKNLK